MILRRRHGHSGGWATRGRDDKVHSVSQVLIGGRIQLSRNQCLVIAGAEEADLQL